MNENVAYVVYDFSYLEDKVDMVMENVHFSVKPGIKCVPNAVAMKVFSAVYNEWQEIIPDKNNAVWTRSVTQPHLGNTGEYCEFYYDFTITVGLFDNDGNLLVENKIVVELKSVKILTDIHKAQLCNYLVATKKQIGLLINFGGNRVEIKRVFNDKINLSEKSVQSVTN